ncbi:slit homolog 1 protein [Copidosoma floridanum]|uniref:slit homolog 1 protein n=1 Tax=Copidosoma floridanum TaxID=29053 RepID=UPI0006C94107|nr:slit homolog 1 protein [Copidosoma floridanum]
MWLAVLMLAAMASGSAYRCPDFCHCQSPRVECHGHAPQVRQFDELPGNFTELAIRDVADSKELDHVQKSNSSFLKDLLVLEITNITNWSDQCKVPWYANPLNAPKELDSLDVRLLNLSYNSLKNFGLNGCEVNFRNALEVLDLGHNQIEKVIFRRGSTAKRHWSLTWLNLAHNVIDDCDAMTFGGLQKLVYLDLSNNDIHTLQEVLDPLVSLQRLFLKDNKLEHIGVAWFQQLKKLEELDLSKNKLVLIPPDALKPLTNLLILKWDDPVTKTNSSIPLDTKTPTTATFPTATSTDTYRRRTGDIQFDSRSSSGVEALNFSHNSLTSCPFTKDTPNTKIRVLDLGYNKIYYLNEISLPKLRWINFANNQIDEIHYDTFEKLKSLEYLNLSNNKLHTLKGILDPLTSLQRLFLSGNKFEHIGSTWFQSLTKLVELDVSRNKLTFILADPLQTLTSLSVLNLAENPLIKRDLSLLLSTGRRLEILDASRIGLVRVPAALTHSIRMLKLAGNQLTSIASGDFDSYPLLRVLDLSDNRLVGIEEDALGRLDNLEELNLSGNILPTIPKSLPNGLKILDLSQNALSNLKVNDLQNLHLLTELNLSGNVITEIEGGFFRQLTALNVLDISDNPFVKLPSDTLNGPSNLMVLRMSGLTSLKTEENQNQDTAFPFLTPENLVKLDVSRSPALAAQLLADNAALSACKSLQELNLAYTSISSIRFDLGYVLPQLQKLNLIGNDWNCTDDQLWLGEWIRQHDASLECSTRCKTPSKFEGKLLQRINKPVISRNTTTVSTNAPKLISTTPGKTDSSPLTTAIPKAASESTAKFITTTYITTTQYPLKIEKSRGENKTAVHTTQILPSIKRKSQSLTTTNNENESINLSTVAYTAEHASNAEKWEPTKLSIHSTTQTNGIKNNENKRLDTTESILVSSTIGNKSNNKKAKSDHSTAPTTPEVTDKTTTTTITAPSTVSPTPAPSTISPTTVTTVGTNSTSGGLLIIAIQKQSGKLMESMSGKHKEVKEDAVVIREMVKRVKPPSQDQVFSEFSHSKLLFANEEAQELNSRVTESGAHTSPETLASGAHPGMLVLLGASMVAAAALTVVLSRRAAVSRRERQYQRHENIEVHALTPTTELW